MNAEIITSGTELLLGDTVDTNSMYIARALRDIGVNLYFKTSVGDNVSRMALVLRQALGRSDVVIVTGGLGPTVDDVTREAVSEATGRPLLLHPECMAHIEAIFSRWGREVRDNNRRQGYLPEGAIPIPNPVGTAPGSILELEEGTVICLPGVPREMERLMQETVLPYLEARIDAERVVIKSRTLRTVGQGESWIDERIDTLMRSANPTVGLAAHLGIVDVRVTARAATHEAADGMLDEMEQAIRLRVGDDIIFGAGNVKLEAVAASLAAQAGVRLAVVESATGGEIARLLRGTPDGPKVVAASHIVDSPAALCDLLGISPAKLETFGWISQMTAAEAALALCDTYEGGWGLAVLGDLDVHGDVYGDETGQTCVALATPDATHVTSYPYGGDGVLARNWVTLRALDLLRRQALARLTRLAERG